MQDRPAHGPMAVDSHDGVRGEAAAVCGALEGLGREDDGNSRGEVVSHKETGKVIIGGGILEVCREMSEGVTNVHDVFVVVYDEGEEDWGARGCVDESGGDFVVSSG